MDMSTHEKVQAHLFRIVLDEGPLTLYTANLKSDSPIGTIHRHFKEMVKHKWLKTYSSLKDTSRRKIHYGPTLLGIVYFYSKDKSIQDRLERYYLKWIRFEDFLSELDEEGFDVKNVSSSKNSITLFKKYVHYFAGVEEQIDMLKEPENIPRDMLLYIGEFLLVRKPEYMRIWEELYKRMPKIKKNVDEYIDSTIEFYNKLKTARES